MSRAPPERRLERVQRTPGPGGTPSKAYFPSAATMATYPRVVLRSGKRVLRSRLEYEHGARGRGPCRLTPRGPEQLDASLEHEPDVAVCLVGPDPQPGDERKLNVASRQIAFDRRNPFDPEVALSVGRDFVFEGAAPAPLGVAHGTPYDRSRNPLPSLIDYLAAERQTPSKRNGHVRECHLRWIRARHDRIDPHSPFVVFLTLLEPARLASLHDCGSGCRRVQVVDREGSIRSRHRGTLVPTVTPPALSQHDRVPDGRAGLSVHDATSQAGPLTSSIAIDRASLGCTDPIRRMFMLSDTSKSAAALSPGAKSVHREPITAT